VLNAKPSIRRTRRNKAMPVLGAAGLSLSLASGASAAVNPQAMNAPTGAAANAHHVAISEEEVTDVSLASFYLFDRENGATPPTRLRFAMAACGGCGCGCGGCGCWTGTYYNSSVFDPAPDPPPARPPHQHRPVHPRYSHHPSD
jgi:hypothetical protein